MKYTLIEILENNITATVENEDSRYFCEDSVVADVADLGDLGVWYMLHDIYNEYTESCGMWFKESELSFTHEEFGYE